MLERQVERHDQIVPFDFVLHVDARYQASSQTGTGRFDDHAIQLEMHAWYRRKVSHPGHFEPVPPGFGPRGFVK
ncbi:hypothetical protein D9M68_989470 [compost metagenome]